MGGRHLPDYGTGVEVPEDLAHRLGFQLSAAGFGVDAAAMFAKRTVLGTVGLGLSAASVAASFVDHSKEMSLYLVNREIELRFEDPATREQIEAWILKMRGLDPKEGPDGRELKFGVD